MYLACAILLFLSCINAAYVEVQADPSLASSWEHVWEACVGSGHAALGLRADWREHLKAVREDLGFQRVRFHGLFNDDMNVILPTGTSFYNIDSVFDYIFSVGMEPLVELSFSPEALATTNQTIFHYKGYTSPPNATGWWKLMRDFATHLEERYTKEVAHRLFFEVWNEPNCGFLDAPAATVQEVYFSLYNLTATAFKSVDQRFKIGGPVTCASAWLDEFLIYCMTNKVPVDFVSTHLYPTDDGVVNGNVNPVFLKSIATVRKYSSTLPVFYTEYNDGLFGDPPLHDYPFAASYIVKVMAELDGALPLLSWWTFTDVFEEQGFPNQEFDKPTATGWGLISASGIPKPSYRAFELLHQSGDYRFPLKVSDASHVGALATYNLGKHETMVFVWNLVWPTNGTGADEKVSVFVKGITKPATAKLTRVDTYNANAPQAWRTQGRPPYLTPKQVEHYKTVSQLSWTEVRCVPQQDGCLLPSITIPSQGLAVFVLN